LTCIAPIRPLQLCADGGYQPSLGVLGVPLIMVPDKNIPRGENEHADLLAKSAAQGLPLPSEVFFEMIKAPSVKLMERAVLAISPVHSEDWRTEIISFLQGNCLSDDEAYNKRMEARTRPYMIIEGELYKYGVCSPLLNCLSRAEGLN
jgi:hypothetical protein